MSDLIYLFTSNARPLYARDAETVAALPASSHYRFRYREKYVQTALRADWQSNVLAAQQALVAFSLQHPYKHHAAVLIPIRRVKVQRSWVEGSIYLIDFELDGFAPINGGDDEDGSSLRAFNATLAGILGDAHPDKGTSAVRAPAVYPTWPTFDDRPESSAKDWEQVATLLSKCGAFSGHRFCRIASIKGMDESEITAKNGIFHLVGGRSYSLHLAHQQVEEIEKAEWLSIAADDDRIEIVSSPRISIASKYDSMNIVFKALETTESVTSKIVISPESPDTGPSLEIDVRIDRPQGRRLAASTVTAGSGFLLAAPGLFKDIDPTPWGLLMVGAGMLVLGGLAWFNLSPLKLP